MDFLISIIVVMVALVEIQGKSLDAGPQVFNDSSKLPPSSQPSQKRYATKEIILYLTPSQIKALHEGRGFINPQNIGNADSDKHAHGPALQNYAGQLDQPLNHPQPPPLIAPVEEHHSDPFVPIIPPPEYRHSDNYAYINFQPAKQSHNPKPELFFPEPPKHLIYRNKPISKLIPTTEDLHEKKQNNPFLQEHLKDQWYRLLDHNRAHLKELAALSQYNIEKSTEDKKKLLQYAPKYSDHKYELDVGHLLSNNDQHQLEKQHALLHAEAIANSPPVIVHKEINIKHSPVHLIKEVKVPVPTPVLIPIPEPFEVKVPQPYPVPLEIIKPVHIPIIKTQKPISAEIEKHIPFPVPKKVYLNVDRPYFLERGIPLEIPVHKSAIPPTYSHLWKH